MDPLILPRAEIMESLLSGYPLYKIKAQEGKMTDYIMALEIAKVLTVQGKKV